MMFGEVLGARLTWFLAHESHEIDGDREIGKIGGIFFEPP